MTKIVGSNRFPYSFTTNYQLTTRNQEECLCRELVIRGLTFGIFHIIRQPTTINNKLKLL
jgi:hypothetical protein